MSLFKEQIARDVNMAFMNLDEFSDYHMVNKKRMIVQVDNNELVDRERRYKYNLSLYSDGIYLKELLIYVRASEFGAAPKVGSILNFDGKDYTVADVIDEDGIYSIQLNANRSAR